MPPCGCPRCPRGEAGAGSTRRWREAMSLRCRCPPVSPGVCSCGSFVPCHRGQCHRGQCHRGPVPKELPVTPGPAVSGSLPRSNPSVFPPVSFPHLRVRLSVPPPLSVSLSASPAPLLCQGGREGGREAGPPSQGEFRGAGSRGLGALLGCGDPAGLSLDCGGRGAGVPRWVCTQKSRATRSHRVPTSVTLRKGFAFGDMNLGWRRTQLVPQLSIPGKTSTGRTEHGSGGAQPRALRSFPRLPSPRSLPWGPIPEPGA